MTKNVKVNENCIGCWACISICPDIFGFSDEGTAYTKVEVDCSSNECAKDAMDACPVWAIECE